MRKASRVNVIPRYTPGSPGLVDEDQARRVASQERSGYLRYLSGIYGPDDVTYARLRGLDGIVYSSAERGKKVDVFDLITEVATTFDTFDDYRIWSEFNRMKGSGGSRAGTSFKIGDFGPLGISQADANEILASNFRLTPQEIIKNYKASHRLTPR